MAAAQIEIELAHFAAHAKEDTPSDERQLNEADFGPSQDADHSNLPPPDRGRAAYLFLLACFIVEALVWGFSFSFGVFQEYYTREFAGQANVAVIGTCCMVYILPEVGKAEDVN